MTGAAQMLTVRVPLAVQKPRGGRKAMVTSGVLALERLDLLWEELFPAEQARIIRLLVDRVDIGIGGADVRLKLEGLASLARDLAAPAEAARAAA